MTTSSENKWTNQELEDIGLNLVNEAEKRVIRLRLLGGIAVCLLCKEVIAQYPQLDRICGDIDFAGLSEDAGVITEILENNGFQAKKEFNFVNASSRMLFSRKGLRVDVILDEFRMNHKWSIRDRLLGGLVTLTLEDLILTKLQIVQINQKDIIDLLALGITAGSSKVDYSYILDLCLRKWGFTYTVENNCTKVINYNEITSNLDFPNEALNIYRKIKNELSQSTKSVVWKMRNIVGKRTRWYEVTDDSSI